LVRKGEKLRSNTWSDGKLSEIGKEGRELGALHKICNSNLLARFYF